MRIKADFDGITSAVIGIEDSAKADKTMRLFANTNLARYCDKYTPASAARIMSQNINITEDFVQYPGPYAHFLYVGVVYEPNIPIVEGGEVVGFFSIPNRPKRKTDRKLNFSRDMHPLAQAQWDRAAMVRHMDDLCDDIKGFIERRYRGDGNA